MEKISTSYIARGQDTLYLQKFDVDNLDEKLYWHQYQQNIIAAQNEGVTIRKTFEEINSIESAYTFVIPVYENMPSIAQTRPLTDKAVDTTAAEQVRVNVTSSINLRATANGEVIVVLNADEIVFRLELKNKYKNKYLFIILSSILFTIPHLLSNTKLIELIYFIPYFILGYTFSIIYYKTNNIYSNILAHILHNTVIVIYYLIIL